MSGRIVLLPPEHLQKDALRYALLELIMPGQEKTICVEHPSTATAMVLLAELFPSGFGEKCFHNFSNILNFPCFLFFFKFSFNFSNFFEFSPIFTFFFHFSKFVEILF